MNVHDEGVIAMLFERLNNPQEAYQYKLGSALKMERTVHDKILEDSIEAAQDEGIKQLLRHHREETRGHINRLEQVFGVFGWEVDDSPCPSIEAIHKEAKVETAMTDDAIDDLMVLGSSMATEHHEMAVYESLILQARAMGRDDAVRLLQENLDEERHTLDEVHSAADRIVPQLVSSPA